MGLLTIEKRLLQLTDTCILWIFLIGRILNRCKRLRERLGHKNRLVIWLGGGIWLEGQKVFEIHRIGRARHLMVPPGVSSVISA